MRLWRMSAHAYLPLALPDMWWTLAYCNTWQPREERLFVRYSRVLREIFNTTLEDGAVRYGFNGFEVCVEKEPRWSARTRWWSADFILFCFLGGVRPSLSLILCTQQARLDESRYSAIGQAAKREARFWGRRQHS